MHNVLQVGPAGQENIQHPGSGQGMPPQAHFTLGMLIDRGALPQQAVCSGAQGGGNLRGPGGGGQQAEYPCFHHLPGQIQAALLCQEDHPQMKARLRRPPAQR